MSPPTFEISTESAEATRALGAAIAAWLEPGDVVLLHGDLGAGKTVFAKGVAAALGVATVVSSPSFALVNEYEVPSGGAITRLLHLDLYRLEEPELDSIGWDELIATTAAAILVEWPERASAHLPDRFLLVEIVPAGNQSRRFRFSAIPGHQDWRPRMAALQRRVGGE